MERDTFHYSSLVQGRSNLALDTSRDRAECVCSGQDSAQGLSAVSPAPGRAVPPPSRSSAGGGRWHHLPERSPGFGRGLCLELRRGGTSGLNGFSFSVGPEKSGDTDTDTDIAADTSTETDTGTDTGSNTSAGTDTDTDTSSDNRHQHQH